MAIERSTSRRGFRVVAVLVVLAITIFVLLRVIGSGPPPNIVVVVMDTVRWDHLPCYGYDRDTAPNLTALLESSRIYTNAYSVSSWTSPAHASLFTGHYPGSGFKLGIRTSNPGVVPGCAEYSPTACDGIRLADFAISSPQPPATAKLACRS